MVLDDGLYYVNGFEKFVDPFPITAFSLIVYSFQIHFDHGDRNRCVEGCGRFVAEEEIRRGYLPRRYQVQPTSRLRIRLGLGLLKLTLTITRVNTADDVNAVPLLNIIKMCRTPLGKSTVQVRS
jgi:hypothetical protein